MAEVESLVSFLSLSGQLLVGRRKRGGRQGENRREEEKRKGKKKRLNEDKSFKIIKEEKRRE